MKTPATVRNSSVVGVVVAGIAGFIAAVIVLHIIFALLEANSANNLVTIVAAFAGFFSWLFIDLFILDDAKLQTVVNYGLAAALYLLIAGAIHRGASRSWWRNR